MASDAKFDFRAAVEVAGGRHCYSYRMSFNMQGPLEGSSNETGH